jgi:hypothetical protein
MADEPDPFPSQLKDPHRLDGKLNPGHKVDDTVPHQELDLRAAGFDRLRPTDKGLFQLIGNEYRVTGFGDNKAQLLFEISQGTFGGIDRPAVGVA